MSPRSALRAPLLAAFVGAIVGCTTPAPDDAGELLDTTSLEQGAGISCAGMDACFGSGGETYTAAYRIGATATSRAELLQFFTAPAGTPQTLRVKLRQLRIYSGSAKVYARILRFEGTPSLIGDDALGAATVVASASRAVTGLAGDTDFSFIAPGATTSAMSGGTHALQLFTDDESSGTVLVGVGSLVNGADAYGNGASRRSQRAVANVFGDARFRPAGAQDLAFALALDDDECATPGVCGANATCANTTGSFTCTCVAGFEGTSTAGAPASCVDVNECATNNGDCDPLTVCTNVDGGRTCGGCPGGYLGDGETGCVPTLVTDATTGFFGTIGQFSNGNRTWSTTPGPGHGYRGVTLARTFGAGEEFELVTSWAADYRGACMMYGPSVSHLAFTDGALVYCGSAGSSGYASGTFFGQYHAPIQNGGAATTKYWFRHARSGNTLSLEYSASSAEGPWTNVLAPVTVGPGDKVVLVLGEAGSTELEPLQIHSLRAGTCPSGYAASGASCVDVDECLTDNGGCGAGNACTNTPGSRTCGYSDGVTGFTGALGAFSNGGRTWSTTPGPGYGNRGVTVARTFAPGEAFELVTSWAANYRGACMVYGTGVAHTSFNGGENAYCSALSSSGYASGTYFGQYHAPLQNLGQATTAYWLRHAREGNTLSLQYSTGSATGPWTNVLAPVTVGAGDKVVLVLGEAGDTEVQPLELVSLRATGCPAGYAGVGGACVDVNECETNNGGCDANATCTNTAGSRTCACNAPYTGDGLTCSPEHVVLDDQTFATAAEVSAKGWTCNHASPFTTGQSGGHMHLHNFSGAECWQNFTTLTPGRRYVLTFRRYYNNGRLQVFALNASNATTGTLVNDSYAPNGAYDLHTTVIFDAPATGRVKLYFDNPSVNDFGVSHLSLRTAPGLALPHVLKSVENYASGTDVFAKKWDCNHSSPFTTGQSGGHMHLHNYAGARCFQRFLVVPGATYTVSFKRWYNNGRFFVYGLDPVSLADNATLASATYAPGTGVAHSYSFVAPANGFVRVYFDNPSVNDFGISDFTLQSP